MFVKLKIISTLIFLGIFALGFGFYIGKYQHFHESQNTQLIFLSVGQGDCTFFQHQGYHVLIDAGPKTEWIDAAQKLIIPQLLKEGVRTIDLLLLSHPDMDHIGGLQSLSKQFKIGTVCIPSIFKKDPFMNQMLKIADIKPAQILWVHEYLEAKVGAFSIDLLEPIHKPNEPDNDGSLFVKLSSKNRSAVFTGDASSIKEIQMISYLPSWKADILKAGHHGSRHSTSEEWLKAIQPKYVILSSGINNSYHHPHPKVLQRISKSGALHLRTDQLGSIKFKLIKERWTLINSASQHLKQLLHDAQ